MFSLPSRAFLLLSVAVLLTVFDLNGGGIISATNMQVKSATNPLPKPPHPPMSILSTEGTDSQIVQICRSGMGMHSLISDVERT
jgi:hypothetical protein